MQKPKRFSRKSTAQGNQSHLNRQNENKQYKNYKKFHEHQRDVNKIIKFYKPVKKQNEFFRQQQKYEQKHFKVNQKRSKSQHNKSKRGESVQKLMNLNQKEFIQMYKNDPFAKHKLDYLIKKNQQKIAKDKRLQNLVQKKFHFPMNEISSIGSQSGNGQKGQGIQDSKSFTKCKSQNDLMQTERCMFYKDLITTSQQAYSGVSD